MCKIQQRSVLLNFRKLQPAFVPEKKREKRKREPIYHEDLLSKDVKKVHTYNPAICLLKSFLKR